MSIELSVLIPSIPERLESLAGLVVDLTAQAGGLPVEVLVFLDNKRRTTGAKLNNMIEAAQGGYVTVADDDDRVAPTYVRDLLDAIHRNPGVDCIVFDVALYIGGKFVKIFRYGVEYGWTETDDCIYREPGPLMCWKRQVAVRYKFPDQCIDEDSAWIAAGPWKHEPIWQARIDTVLYDYLAVPGHP